MDDLGTFALRLSEASEPEAAAEHLLEHLRRIGGEDLAARVYLLGPGDRCQACPRQDRCAARDRCFHLTASRGVFAGPALNDQRVPRLGTPWGQALVDGSATPLRPVPGELLGGDAAPPPEALLVPLEAGGERLGIVGVRGPRERLHALAPTLGVAAFLTASAIRLLKSLGTATRRFEQLLLVNDLGRKVNSILNDELLLRQAAVDIHRTFGFHNVMIFMLDPGRTHLELKAQASRGAIPPRNQTRIRLGEGVIGRVHRVAATQVIDDVARDEGYVNWYPDTRSEIAVPIQIGGVVEGVLNVESDRTGAFGPSDRLVLETVANQIAIAVENARLFSMVKEREDRYRTLVESSPGAVLHLDEDGRVTYANPAASTITGRTRADLVGLAAGVLELAVSAERPAVEAAITGALRGVRLRDLEFHILHTDGTPRLLTASLEPVVGETGDPRGAVMLARDMTRERQLQEKLAQSEKLTAMGTLVSGVAHELNNPLAAILGLAQILRSMPADQWAHKDIESIEQNARRCQRIVESLLAFARQNRMTRRPASLNEILGGVLDLHEYQLRMDDIRIERDLDPALPTFPVDVTRWQQVFVNLISNAQQAMVQADSPERLLRVETRHAGGKVVIRVRDTGPGIPEGNRNLVFNPFFTTKETGTGLGLGICFGIVKDHGGLIELETDRGPGASFRITVPVTDAVALPPPEIPPTAVDPTDAGQGRRVLVVDDDTFVCDVVRRTLTNHHYEVLVAHSGADGFKIAREQPVDAIVTDVRMPGELDGIDLYDALVAADATWADAIVFMTGNILDSRTMDRLDRLAVRCVQKPFDIRELAAVVHEVARRGRPAPSGAAAPGSAAADA